MLGLGGFGQGNIGMGVELGFRYSGRSQANAAIRDYGAVERAASRADKRVLAGQKMMRRGWTELGYAAGLGAVAVGISAAGRRSEQAYANLRSLEVKYIQQIKDEMRELIIHENLATPFHEAEDALYDMISAGVRVKDLVPSMRMVGITALATRGSVQEATNAYTDAYNLFLKNMPGSIEERTQRWADIFSATVMTYKTKLPELGFQFSKVAKEAESLGYPLEELLPAIGTLLTGGLGEESGRSLRSMMQRIGKAEEVLGLKFTDAKGRALPLLQIIDLLNQKFGDTLTVAESELLEKAFDRFGKKAAQTLMALSSDYKKGIDRAKEVGYSQRMAGKITNTFNYDLKRLGNSFISLGNTMAENGYDLRVWTRNLKGGVTTLDDMMKADPFAGEIFSKGIGAFALFLTGGGLIKIVRGAAAQWGVAGGNAFVAAFSRSIIGPFGAALILAYIGASNAIKKELEKLGIDSKTGEPKQVWLYDPLTKTHYTLKQPSEQFRGTVGWRREERAEAENILKRTEKSRFAIPYTGPDLSEKQIMSQGGLVEKPMAIGAGAGPTINDNRKFEQTLVIKDGDPDSKKKARDFVKQINQDADWEAVKRGESPSVGY